MVVGLELCTTEGVGGNWCGGVDIGMGGSGCVSCGGSGSCFCEAVWSWVVLLMEALGGFGVAVLLGIV